MKSLPDNMARIESTLLVQKSLGDVFAFLNACESHVRFIPNMIEFKQTSPGAFGRVGATAQGLLSYFGLMKIGVQYEIIEHEPNYRLAMKGQIGPILFKDGYILKNKSNRTEITFWLDLHPTGWAKFFAPFMSLIGKIHAYETLRNLKRELAPKESASSRRTPSSQ